MESLALEVKKFGINSMLVEPGFFRTELLSHDSTHYTELSINDYADDTRAAKTAWQGMDGKQGGDPQKLAEALIQLAKLEHPPARFAAGADAFETFETKAKALKDKANALRELSSSLSLDTD